MAEINYKVLKIIMSVLNDLTGRRFGKLVVIKRGLDYVSPSGSKKVRWVCRCDCGNTALVTTSDLLAGKSKSCGCMRNEQSSKRIHDYNQNRNNNDKRIDILKHEKNIKQWVSENISKHVIAKRLNCNPKTLERYLWRLGIDYDGNQGSKGENKYTKQYIPLKEYLLYSDNPSSNKIRQKLIREGYKERKCEICGMTEWMGNEIPLELHHIDGNHKNNQIENFQILCPNCHALTDTYRGKNKK